MISDFNTMKGFPKDTPLLLYEEIKSDMIDPIPLNIDSTTAEIGNGDIICFQKDITPEQYVCKKNINYVYIKNNISHKYI